MQPTLTDIAKQTHTSVSTVSRVLAGGPAASRISEPTRQRVIEAANRLGYRPNLVARSLRTRRSNTVALLVSDIANPFFGQIASLIEQSLHRHGYSLMLCNSAEDPACELEYLHLLPGKGIDALIIVPLARNKRVLAEHLPANLPLVVLDRAIPGMPCCVSTDQDQAAGILCDVLQRAGVSRVAVVCGPQHVVTHRRRCEIVTQRLHVIDRHEGPAQKETGRNALIRFVDQRPEAIIATNNFLGQGVIDAIDELENPPILGCFDEIPMMHLLPLPIACSVQDVPQLAEGCVNQLLPQLQGKPAPQQPLTFPARVIANPSFRKRVGKMIAGGA